nr:hypothetical protein [Acidobacteriota bacterium]
GVAALQTSFPTTPPAGLNSPPALFCDRESMRRLIATILFLAATTASAAGTFTTYEALEYTSPGGEPLLMDLRGAWISGDRFGGGGEAFDEFLDAQLRTPAAKKRRTVGR